MGTVLSWLQRCHGYRKMFSWLQDKVVMRCSAVVVTILQRCHGYNVVMVTWQSCHGFP